MNKLISILLFVPSLIIAQEGNTKVLNYRDIDNKAVHFGFSIGTNFSDFNFIRNESSVGKGTFEGYKIYSDMDQPLQTIGFNVNIVSEYRFNKYFSLRFTPGLILTSARPVTFTKYTKADTTSHTANIESNYLDFPVYIKFSSKRINNYRPYLLTGGSFRYDLVARKNYPGSADNGTMPAIKLQKDPPIDISFDFGFGIDFYLVYFKFSTELKLSTGLMNVLYDEPPPDQRLYDYWNSLDGLKSSLFIISLSFE